jgi:hypothetical protein
VTVYRQLEAAADERGITTGAMFIEILEAGRCEWRLFGND